MKEPGIPEAALEHAVSMALAEDLGRGDVTSRALLPPELTGQAALLVKAPGVLAGIEVARAVFLGVDPTLAFETIIPDGSAVRPGDIAGRVGGKVAGILQAERTALNFLQRLSGIASLTAEYVARVQGYAVEIRDTRKTTPGLRALEKYAVRMGGGRNHRFDLGAAVLIKDNHLVALRELGMTLKEIIGRARQNAPPGIEIEVEVSSLAEAGEAALAGADIIMFDNMSPDDMTRGVSLVGGLARTEASGGVTLENVHEIARTGVDIISIGALTHSVKALDISLELDPHSLRLS